MALIVRDVLRQASTLFDLDVSFDYQEGIPLFWRANTIPIPNSATWRYGDNHLSLLEFKIDLDSHVLYGVTLTLAETVVRTADPPIELDSCSTSSGLPIVADLSGWQSTLRAPQPFAVYWKDDRIYLVLEQSVQPTDILHSGSIEFIVSGQALMALICSRLSQRIVDQIPVVARAITTR